MVSVENFYEIIYQELLGPSGLNAFYYHPFGTQDNFIVCQKFGYQMDYMHVLFYDQEPMWVDNFSGAYDSLIAAWSVKYCKILANSEKSHMKNLFCQQREMLDWYYFYHGFAALDWFRDAKFFNVDFAPTKVYLSYNHLVLNQRAYRLALTAKLIGKNLLPFGEVSLHARAQDVVSEIVNDASLLTSTEKHLISENLLPIVPLIADIKEVDATFSARLSFKDIEFWKKSFWHIVNETVFFESKLHLTEKIFKPIIASRPFILVAAPGNLAYLKTYGFKTFDAYIDESYDQELDPSLRIDKIVIEIQKLCNLPAHELTDMYHDMFSLLDYNKKHFFGEFRFIIANELVDNFLQCVNLWNTNRVDDRYVQGTTVANKFRSMLLA